MCPTSGRGADKHVLGTASVVTVLLHDLIGEDLRQLGAVCWGWCTSLAWYPLEEPHLLLRVLKV